MTGVLLLDFDFGVASVWQESNQRYIPNYLGLSDATSPVVYARGVIVALIALLAVESCPSDTGPNGCLRAGVLTRLPSSEATRS